MSDLLNQEHITDINIENSIKGSYLDYSMSVIIGRALPDAKDGLKPVHRRILYAMSELHLSPKTPYKKSARIVGDVIGKYHPHGDSSVYDALVRMAQPFSMRVPLVDGQGNFGSVDGDNAAAMRYTEARMANPAVDIISDLDKDTVNFTPTYDDTGKEPTLLPTKLPLLLANGSEGIAVGMATKIPPHNLGELLDAVLHLVDNPDATIEDLMGFIQGPDFPTGATIHGKQGFTDAYKTGRGKVKLRAKHHIEQKGKKEVLVLDELPYQVNKAKLILQIADLAKDKIVEGISEVRDESDKDGTRVVIELKKDAMAEIVLNNLYKTTPIQTTFGVILLAVYNKEPKIFNLKEILEVFVSHRKTVIIRHLSAIQSQAILDMRLGRLTGLQREKLEDELKELLKLIKELELILKSEDRLSEIIKEEAISSKEKYATPRITNIEDSYDDIDMEDLIPNEPMVVTITHNGYVKRVPIKLYEKQRRGGKGKVAVTTHDDDFIEKFFVSNTHATLMFVTNLGQLYWLKVYRIPEGSRTAKGKAVVNLINLKQNETIMAIIPTNDFDSNKSLTFFTKLGIVKRTSLNDYSNIRSNGVRAIVLSENDEVVTAQIADTNSKYLMIFTALGQVIRFEIDKLKTQGRSTKGVRGIRFKNPKDYVVDADIIENEQQELLTVSENGIGKRTEVEAYRLTNRAGSGVISMKLSPKTGKTVIGNVFVDEEQDLMMLTSIGKMIRVDMQTIRKAGRNTSGVTIVNVDKGDKVVSIAKCPKNKEDELDIQSAEDMAGINLEERNLTEKE
ncbi:MAG: DNA gyrase subunit A [Campylobacteraceae bacterium 4484_166]|nr:MAG: DNA gyrase subunit A [Campylobacteraceae bacterium 4484_166]